MPAHYLTHLSLQEQVDYVDTCQKRVSADTLAIVVEDTLALAAGDHEYDLPDDLVELHGIYQGETPLAELTTAELLAGLSGLGPDRWIGELSYAVVGRTLYVLPQPSAVGELTIVYVQRAPDFASDDDLVLEGDERELLEQLLDAYVTFDRGETEVGQVGLVRYLQDAKRIRTANRERGGVPSRRPVASHDLFL